jgi:hypothetical protein
MDWPWRRIQLAGAVALVIFPVSVLVLRCFVSPAIPFISHSREAPWVMAPRRVSAKLQQWGITQVPVDTFKGSFQVGVPDGPVTLRLRALKRFGVSVNGVAVTDALSDGARWRRETRVDVTGLLRVGQNEIQVEVQNESGPALLSLRLDGLAEPVVADSSWRVEADGRDLGFAARADDTRLNPAAFAAPTPIEGFVEQADTLLLLFTIGVLGFAFVPRLLSGRASGLPPALVLAPAGLAWLGLFAGKLTRLPLRVGFDVNHHLAYVAFLREEGAVPLPTDGWSMYHPPLFYAASAAMAQLGDLVSGGDPSPIFLKLIPFLCGIGTIWVAFELARRLFPEDPRARVFAALFAAVLPMNVYTSAYFSNEMPHAFLVGLALLVTVELLLAERTSPWKSAALALLVGLAALTKFTALAVAPIALFFLVAKLFIVDRASPARVSGLSALFVVTFLCVAGWFYARNWIHFGNPVFGNWSLSDPGQIWWQQPGFHTLAYYTGFGESLRHPYLAGFHSFWDGIYSTLWGDGGIAGRVLPNQRHALWNYEFMSAGYLLALPATALVLFGAVRCAVLALRGRDPRRRAALSFLTTAAYAVGFAVLAMTVQLPFFAQAKAFYGLSVAAPLAVFFAVGAARCDEALVAPRWRPLRALFYGWLSMFAAVLFLAYAA